MTGITMTIEGLDKAIANVNKAKDGIPGVIRLGLTEAMAPMVSEMQTYPLQPAPRDPRYVYIRGMGTMYAPTGKMYKTSQNYGKTINTHVERDGNDYVGVISSPATYSIYLRGDLQGNGPAWMHKGVWSPLSTIVDKNMPTAVMRLENRIADYLERLA